MTEKKERLVHRLCPCFSHDIEGIQTWLEDLAMDGLLLEPDGRILSIFTFRRGAPRKALYRLEASSVRGSLAADGPDPEMRETCAQMGWEYLVNFGSFHIYRSFDPYARELNTDPAVQALTLNTLKKDQRNTVILTVLDAFLLLFLSTSPGIYLWRLAVTAGPLLPLSVIGLFIWAFVSSLLATIRLSRYQKRLRSGENLTRQKEWRPTAHLARCARLLPGTLVLIMLISLGNVLLKTTDRQPLDAAPAALPFVTLEDVFPEGAIKWESGYGEYNTYVFYETALSANYEWDEYAYVTLPEGTCYGIANVEFHDTAAPWLAKLTARDHYRYEQRRFNSKRFEDLQAPETEFDTLYIFRSYGILHIVGQEGRQVFHATVQLTDPNDIPCWELWLRAMEAKLCG